MNIENTSKTPSKPRAFKKTHTVKMPHFLSFEEQQELDKDINALARKYSLILVKIEAPRYKRLYQSPSVKQLKTLTDPTQVLALKSYRPKMKIQGVLYSPLVGPSTPFETPEEAFTELTTRVKKRFKDNRDKWSEEKKAKTRAYLRKWKQANPDKMEAYKLRRQGNKA